MGDTGAVATRDDPPGKEAPPARRPRGRPALPPDRIIAAALRIVEEEGHESLSMRTLAQRLGSGTATLYRHFENRAALVAGITDHLFGEMALDHETLTARGWWEAYRTVAHAMFDVLNRHGNVAPLLVGQTPLGPNAMALRERCLTILFDGGFPPQVAARAYAALSRYVLGFAVQLGASADPPDHTSPSEAFRAADPALFPATVAVSAALPVPLEEEFAFGLELLLNGLDHLRDEQP